MSKQIKILAVSIASIIVLSIIGIFGFNMMKPTDNKLEDAIATQKHNTPKEVDKSVVTEDEDVVVSTEKPVDPESIKMPDPAEKDITKEAFYESAKNYESVDGFSAEEAKEAVSFATNYATTAMTDYYFLGGEWSKNGFKNDELIGKVSPWYSPEIIKDLEKIDKYEGQEYRDWVLPVVTYFTGMGNDVIDASPKCSSEAYDQKMDSGCVIEPLSFSDVEYYAEKQEDGSYSLKMKFSAQFDLAVVIREGNKDAKTTIKNTYIFNIDKANKSDGTEGYMISGYDTKYDFSKVSEIK